jgi:ATP-dependent Clp protease ATP-binding subunit ClpA
VRLCEILVGQTSAIDSIVPYVHMHQAGLAPEGRPICVFLLLGPTGTGKTRTVEALAEVLHGSSKNLLKIDCGEFQMEHEVAKLVGAPPGYLGHRETQPLLTQAKLTSVSSESSPISLLLFDEIEKAAPSLVRLLLGVLDKATLRLGDNSTVNFENTMIFLTSNLGAKSIQRAGNPDFGFEAMVKRDESVAPEKLQNIGMNAVRQKFSRSADAGFRKVDLPAPGRAKLSNLLYAFRPQPSSRSGHERRIRCARVKAHGSAAFHAAAGKSGRAEPYPAGKHCSAGWKRR